MGYSIYDGSSVFSKRMLVLTSSSYNTDIQTVRLCFVGGVGVLLGILCLQSRFASSHTVVPVVQYYYVYPHAVRNRYGTGTAMRSLPVIILYVELLSK